MNLARKRALKEVNAVVEMKDPTIVMESYSDITNLLIKIYIVDNPLYDPATPFTLSYKLTHEYPFQAPIVLFVGPNVPVHPHIYTNGHICLDILYDSWTPAQTIKCVCLSLQSMIQCNSELKRPDGDKRYCLTAPSDPSKSKWLFHDDNV